MTRTEYLFGYPKDKYGDDLIRIAKERIEDANTLESELYANTSYDPSHQDKKSFDISKRLLAVREAKLVWLKILEDKSI